jgi:multidrug resistance efflux pump
MASPHAPIATPRAQRLEEFRQRTLPLLVWIVCALVALGMLFARARRFEYVGVANSPIYEISSHAPATVASVSVGLYDRVHPGDVVAVLDDTQVQAEIETAKANVRQLSAQLDAAQAGLGGASGPAALSNDMRRFAIDENRQRLEALALKVTLETNRVELDRRKVAVRRAEALRAASLVSEADYDNTRLFYEQIKRRTEENEALLKETEATVRSTQARKLDHARAAGTSGNDPIVFQPLREAINVEIQRLKEIEARREVLFLKSPVAGRVSRIRAARGQSVVAGEPILLIEEEAVREIVAYLREGNIRSVASNSKVRVTSARNGKVVDSVVVAVGPGLEALPERLRRNFQVVEYGLGVTIAASPLMGLTPGELVTVHFVGTK